MTFETAHVRGVVGAVGLLYMYNVHCIERTCNAHCSTALQYQRAVSAYL